MGAILDQRFGIQRRYVTTNMEEMFQWYRGSIDCRLEPCPISVNPDATGIVIAPLRVGLDLYPPGFRRAFGCEHEDVLGNPERLPDLAVARASRDAFAIPPDIEATAVEFGRSFSGQRAVLIGYEMKTSATTGPPVAAPMRIRRRIAGRGPSDNATVRVRRYDRHLPYSPCEGDHDRTLQRRRSPARHVFVIGFVGDVSLLLDSDG